MSGTEVASTRRRIRAVGQERRETSLDGLRGLASLVVVFHHCLLLFPSLAAPYYTGAPGGPPWSLEWWIVNTPIHALWEGKGAVYVFFILSGFVLTLPVIRGRVSWVAYYPQRLVRLYLPIWVAVALGVASYLFVPRGGPNATLWLSDPDRPAALSITAVIRDMTLIGGAGGLVSPLWSLRWEILFSLALPLYIWLAVQIRKYSAPALGACVALSGLGAALNQAALLYLPMFMIGVIFAVNERTIRRLGKGISSRRWAWPALVIIGVTAIVAHWIMQAFGADSSGLGGSAAIVLIGAVLLVVGALCYPPAERLLTSKAFQWFGRISFSLYLVHEPIIVAYGLLLGPALAAAAIPLAVATALLVAQVFYWLVERPSHKLAKILRAHMTPADVPNLDTSRRGQ